MTDRDDDDDMLGALFHVARADRAVPPGEDWLARVTGDALAEAAASRAAPLPVPPGPLAQLRALMGGWRGLGGLAAAGVAGLVIGLSAPGVVTAPVEGVIWGSALSDTLFTDDLAWVDLPDGG